MLDSNKLGDIQDNNAGDGCHQVIVEVFSGDTCFALLCIVTHQRIYYPTSQI